MNVFKRLKDGLSKTRHQISSFMESERELNEEFYETLEDALISADAGIDLTTDMIDCLRSDVEIRNLKTVDQAFTSFKETLVGNLKVEKHPDEFPPKPWVVLVIGVNGVGKTTTIGKITNELVLQGKKVLLGAVDTFRAGAIEQLKVWADRTGADFVSQHEGADPASVAFDALQAAKSRDTDVVILDTAGRLHNKVNLMNELDKIVRIIKKNTPHAPNEVLLVVDGTTGQNAIKQTETFNGILPLTGLVITKLDGTAKGGIALSLARKFKVPIRKIGVGEGIEDLQDFNAEDYVEAMFGDFND